MWLHDRQKIAGANAMWKVVMSFLHSFTANYSSLGDHDGREETEGGMLQQFLKYCHFLRPWMRKTEQNKTIL